MTLASVFGQQRAVDSLRAALRGGSVHHAYLFAGPEGVGKERAAVGLAQALTCTEQPLEGCGVCSSCTRIERGSHPDVLWAMPDAERVERGLAGRADITGTPSRDIRVEQIRTLQERLSLRGLESPRKVVIVASAEAMNPQAQNAFLKTLEEPPSDTTLVLLCSALDRLLPTIRSRCSKVHFGPLPLDYLTERVQKERKLDADTAALVAVMAGGSLGRALALNVKALERRKALITAFEAVFAGSGTGSGDALGLLHFAEEHGSSREDAGQALAILTVWLRDVSVARVGARTGLANRDLEPLAREAAARLSEASLHRRFGLVERAQYVILERNGAPRLQLERMLIEMMETR